MTEQKTKLRYLSYEEEDALFATIDPNAKYHGKNARLDKARQGNSDLLMALLDLGCRYSEAGGMAWNQVDLVARKI
ncbi:hypothetical protein ACPWT1_06555 [Ramlibacter sp. MMS24-I3-19]|uniref:hypothetical protein n=1 Tax=Ramlibacter sp. MMS24-I3-19 TaxID=3416606 RepID=UPI003CFFC602